MSTHVKANLVFQLPETMNKLQYRKREMYEENKKTKRTGLYS